MSMRENFANDLSTRTREIAAVESLVEQLESGIAITFEVDAPDYSASRDGESSIGAHIRHNLDFVNAVLNGIVERRIDYNTRVRDPRIENDLDYAREQMTFACQRLRSLTPELMPKLVVVRSEIDEDVWHTSSVAREIESLHSHTVHHYAIVARLIKERTGRKMCESFGVAPSTLRYREAGESLTAIPS